MQFQFPKPKYDQEGFTQSFDINQFSPEDVNRMYHTYGFVVFNNVIDNESCQNTIDQLWSDIQSRCGKQLDRHDSTTWKFQNWKSSYGFVNGRPLNTKQICLNRHNKNVYHAFKSTYQAIYQNKIEEKLIVMFDRGSAMRPGKKHPEWVTSSIYHYDIRPWQWTGVVKTSRKQWRGIRDYEPQAFKKWLSQGNRLPNIGYTKLAGVLALSETNQLSGGFQCVPGFQNFIHDYCRKTPVDTPIQSDPLLINNFHRIYQRKNSLLIFSRQLPHNIYPNLSQNWRFAQYLRMSPQSSLMLTQFQKQKRRRCVQQFLPKNLQILNDPIAKQVYMIE